MARMSNKRRLEWSFFLNDRTRDLRLTKATLYRLSHISTLVLQHFCRSQLIILPEGYAIVNSYFQIFSKNIK